MSTTKTTTAPATQAPAHPWPFPPRSGPVQWTRAQIAQHARQQLAQLPEAPL